MYGGCARYRFRFGTAAHIRHFGWVPGHQSPERLEGEARLHALGNGFADTGAAVGREMHPWVDTSVVDTQLDQARRVLYLIGEIWQAWERIPRGARILVEARRPRRPSCAC